MEQLPHLQTWLYDHLPVAVAILDRALNYVYANAAYTATQGEAPAQLTGKPLQSSRPEWAALLRRMAEAARVQRRPQQKYEVRLVYPRQPSLIRFWDITLLPIVDDTGEEGYLVYLLDATARVHARQLVDSEARLRGVLDVAIDAIFVMDEHSVVLQVNPAASRLFGYPADELVGFSVEKIIPSPSKEEHAQFVERYLHTGIPHIIGTMREIEGQRKDGTRFPGELSVAELREDEGNGRNFVGIIRDITERKRAEAALTRLLKQNESILNAAGEGIFGLNTVGEIIFINPAGAEMLGYQPEELLGRPSHETTHYQWPDGRAYSRAECPIQAAYRDGATHRSADELFWRKDGSGFAVSYTSTPIYEKDQITGAVVTFTDISERRQLLAELENARARLEAILNTVPIPLLVIDPDGNFILTNGAAIDFFGDSLFWGRYFEMVRLHPETRTPWPASEWAAFQVLRTGAAVNNLEQIAVFPDGREVSILVNAAPVVVEGAVIAVVVVVQDLTRLKEADKAKDAFLALTTHELKSPLATILIWARLALEDPTVRDEALPIIIRNAETQQRLVSDLLDLSRVIYGKVSLHLEPLDAWQVAVEDAENLRTLLEQHELTLVIAPPPAPLPVRADRVRLQQVMTNLLTNAMKFTPPGGTVTVTGARDGNMARLSVSDTGRGIPPEQLTKIFQRFQQLGRERLSGGLGLGLAIVKGLVDLHNGRVAAFSKGLDQGATFSVWLPVDLERREGDAPVEAQVEV